MYAYKYRNRFCCRIESHYTLPSINFKVCSVICSCTCDIALREKIEYRWEPTYSPVFSNSVFGVSGRLIISISCVKINGIYALVSCPAKDKSQTWATESTLRPSYRELSLFPLLSLPSFIEISPIAHVALLHTDMNCGCKFCPSIGINSAAWKRGNSKISWTTRTDVGQINRASSTIVAETLSQVYAISDRKAVADARHWIKLQLSARLR